MVGAPRHDADVPAFWQSLGLPGLIDTHVHFMPKNVMDKVWAYFDSAGPLTARTWPIRYRWPEPERLDHLRALGVRAFPSLVYAHRVGMAEWLNGWAADFASTHADVIHTATFFPEPGVASYVDAALRSGAQLFKVHVQVGGFDPRDPLLDAVWGMVSDAGVPVVAHVGSGPTRGAFTGPGPFGGVLERHRELTAVIAHMGMPEWDEFLGFAERYPNVYVDTTMCFVDFHGEGSDVGTLLAPRLSALQHKVLFGADFPNIPYEYAHQIEALVRLNFDDAWLRDVCWNNAVRLLGLPSAG